MTSYWDLLPSDLKMMVQTYKPDLARLILAQVLDSSHCSPDYFPSDEIHLPIPATFYIGFTDSKRQLKIFNDMNQKILAIFHPARPVYLLHELVYKLANKIAEEWDKSRTYLLISNLCNFTIEGHEKIILEELIRPVYQLEYSDDDNILLMTLEMHQLSYQLKLLEKPDDLSIGKIIFHEPSKIFVSDKINIIIPGYSYYRNGYRRIRIDK